MTITPETIELLKRLEAAATPLPLALVDYGSEAGYIAVQAQPSPVMRGFTKEIGAFYRLEDAELYLTFRNHLRELIEGYETSQTDAAHLMEVGVKQVHEIVDLRQQMQVVEDETVKLFSELDETFASLRTQLADAKAEIERLKRPDLSKVFDRIHDGGKP